MTWNARWTGTGWAARPSEGGQPDDLGVQVLEGQKAQSPRNLDAYRVVRPRRPALSIRNGAPRCVPELPFQRAVCGLVPGHEAGAHVTAYG